MSDQNNKFITTTKAYSLSDFLNACKSKRKSVQISPQASIDAKNSPLQLYTKEKIFSFISKLKESDFDYINTKVFRKGMAGQHPCIDSYLVHLKFWDLYIAFYFLHSNSMWFLKSFHPDNTGETISIEEICKIRSF